MQRPVATSLLLSSLAVASCGTLGEHYLPHEFMGVKFNSNDTPADIRNLARRAQAGDKRGQLELGILFEEVRGVPQDLKGAKDLYLMAATPDSGKIWGYSPTAEGNGRGRISQISSEERQDGLPEAKARLETLQSTHGYN